MAYLAPSLRQAIEEYVGLVVGDLPDGLRFEYISGIVDGYRYIRERIEAELRRICRDAGVNFEEFKRWLGNTEFESLVSTIADLAIENYDYYITHEGRGIRPEDVAKCWRVGEDFHCKLRDDFLGWIYGVMDESILEAVVALGDDIRFLLEYYISETQG